MKTRNVEVSNKVPRLHCHESQIIELFHFLDSLEQFHIPCGDLSIALLDADSIRQLHADFLDDDTITDVITFPGDPEMEHGGEICVCIEYAAQSAIEHQLPFNEELTLYLIHGWLHLAGLDDHSEKDRTAMRRAEAILTKLINEANLLPEFRLE